MGMAEDDRIRTKNRKHNTAYELLEGLTAMGYDNAHIVNHINSALQVSKDSFRNDVYHTMINIVRSRIEKINGISS